MIVTRKSLSRRTVLRGLGASLALPLLDAMIPAATALAHGGDVAAAAGETARRALGGFGRGGPR